MPVYAGLCQVMPVYASLSLVSVCFEMVEVLLRLHSSFEQKPVSVFYPKTMQLLDGIA